MGVPEKLTELNPGIRIFDIRDDEFRQYGRIIDSLDIKEISDVAEKIPMPSDGSAYLASVKDFEELAIARKIKDTVFGTLDTQTGYCYGYNSSLNAAEWHCCSELNIAITPMVLILGKRNDIMADGKMDSSVMKVFYLPKGTVVEIYATTLHFCPCQVNNGGFRCVVSLIRETNIPLDTPCDDKLLFRKNKWIIAHNECKSLIDKGIVPGIGGINYIIRF